MQNRRAQRPGRVKYSNASALSNVSQLRTGVPNRFNAHASSGIPRYPVAALPVLHLPTHCGILSSAVIIMNRRLLLSLAVAFGAVVIVTALPLRFSQSQDRGSKRYAKSKPNGVKKVTKTDTEWKQILTPEQFKVMREKGTEMPFTSPLNEKKDAGTFVCAACGLPLFSSEAKFDSGTGWPSFSQPIAGENVHEDVDESLWETRTEVLCARCDAHLGHVFPDGPKPTGLRYCMNGVALKFAPKEAK